MPFEQHRQGRWQWARATDLKLLSRSCLRAQERRADASGIVSICLPRLTAADCYLIGIQSLPSKLETGIVKLILVLQPADVLDIDNVATSMIGIDVMVRPRAAYPRGNHGPVVA